MRPPSVPVMAKIAQASPAPARAAPPPVLDPDSAYRHAEALRRDPRSANPPDWRVDWADGPWPMKVYRGGRRLPLSGRTGDPWLAALHWLLTRTFAVSRVRFDPLGALPASPTNPVPVRQGPTATLRRPVASGGSMYPTEAYVLLTEARIGFAGAGTYHYDPYRHELLDLSRPDPRPGLRRALALPAREPLPAAVLVLTYRFWKNFYKYGDFACRLGAVDVGVTLGRAARIAAARFSVADVRTAFVDRELNACLGLDGQTESAYALIGLGAPAIPDGVDTSAVADAGDRTAPADGGGAPELVERSTRFRRSTTFDAMHAASLLHALSRPGAPPGAEVTPGRSTPRGAPSRGPAVALPPAGRPDLLASGTMLHRASSGRRFDGCPASDAALATVLCRAAEAAMTLRLATDHSGPGSEVDLYCAVHRVAGVPAGWYRWLIPAPGSPDALVPAAGSGALVSAGSGALVPVGSGADPACARVLQEALFADNVNVELAAFTVHVATMVDFRSGGRGVRGYREQQMAVGAAVEVLTLLATAVGLGSHPFLGFDAARVDQAYGMAGTGWGVQAQVCVGMVRADPCWEISAMRP